MELARAELLWGFKSQGQSDGDDDEDGERSTEEDDEEEGEVDYCYRNNLRQLNIYGGLHNSEDEEEDDDY